LDEADRAEPQESQFGTIRRIRERHHLSIGTFGEDADLKAVYDTERQWLSVACTRARDFRKVGGVEPASEE
jgi:hypothetical protein